jgi:uncharacterized protein (TIGR02757 family)
LTALLKTNLDRLYAEFNYPDSATDPIHLVRRFERSDDREVVGFCATALAFGRVASVLQSIERLLGVMGGRPAEYVRRFEPHRSRRAFQPLGHRWIRSGDLMALLAILRQMLERSGSIEAFFAEGDNAADADIGAALESFSRRAMALDVSGAGARKRRARDAPGVCYFFPRPSAGSACKRLNLFLRWMVRRDALDLGVWSQVSPSRLIVPLDTHVVRVGRCLGLTRYSSPGWAMACDITAALRRLAPDDPVKYDFALCHLGMMNACRFSGGRNGRRTAQSLETRCPLSGLCRPDARRRRPFRSPSARR